MKKKRKKYQKNIVRCLLILKGKVSFIKELSGGLLPTRTEQEIRDHEAWYQQYTQLNDRKRRVIQRWREQKEVNFCLKSVVTLRLMVNFCLKSMSLLCVSWWISVLNLCRYFKKRKRWFFVSERQHICYSVLYAIARPSVRPSVTWVDQSKTVEVRITQPSPQSSPMTLVSWRLTLPRYSKGKIGSGGTE